MQGGRITGIQGFNVNLNLRVLADFGVGEERKRIRKNGAPEGCSKITSKLAWNRGILSFVVLFSCIVVSSSLIES